MRLDHASVFCQILPAAQYEAFAAVIRARTPGREQLHQWQTPDAPQPNDLVKFLAVRGLGYSVLLTAYATLMPEFLSISLTFDPREIANFLAAFDHPRPEMPQAPTMTEPTAITTQILADLLNLCAAELTPHSALCQPQVNLAVDQRMQRERLIHAITTQIRQSLDLPQILNTAVTQIRDFLQADRVLIVSGLGQELAAISYEALSGHPIPSLLGHPYPSGADGAGWQRLSQGEILVFADVAQLEAGLDSPTDPAWIRFWTAAGVQAVLVVPILVQETLWGFLEVHHCGTTRAWQPQEQEFLSHLGNHLSIAIFQSQLYRQLQQQKATLEERVLERTQALRQSLLSAESAHRVKSDFLATISHELRSPLTCVIGMSATLLRWPLGPLTEKQRHYLETIHNSGTHLLELINRILELSQVEVGQTALRISHFSLSQLARQVLQRVRAMAITAQLSLKLELEIPPEADLFAADPHRLQQVLLHLLTNAIKFTPAHGHVTLRLAWEGDAVIFAVSDTGIGIPDHLQPLLFQLFQQLDTPYRRRQGGMGLGLAFTQQIVDLHHGSITVSSVEHQGSTFTIRIPNQALSASPIPTPPSTHTEGRIILIEDHEEAATLICELLTAAGYQVIWMTDAVIEQLAHFQPVVVIISQHFAHNDLPNLVPQLQALNPTHGTKVVLLDAPANPTIPADAHLSHPLDPEELLAHLARLIQFGVQSLTETPTYSLPTPLPAKL